MEFIIAAVMFFVCSTAAFSYHYTKKTDRVALFFTLFASFTASILWFLSIPALILLGGSWLLSRVLNKLLKLS